MAKKKSKQAPAGAESAPPGLPIEATGAAAPRSGNSKQADGADAGVDQLPAGLLRKKAYRQELGGLQVDLFKLQAWMVSEKLRLVVILEGLGPAGKRGHGAAHRRRH